jgi:glycosyltransferase involved in cell wall biosynthesis
MANSDLHSKKKIVVFHPALAPYRIDFFNALSTNFSTVFYFSNKNVSNQKFNQEELKKSCNFPLYYLTKGFSLSLRSIRFGIFKIINKQDPDIIICSEFSQVTCLVILHKLIKKKNFKIYTICDDSIDNAKNRKGLRLRLKKWVSKNVDGLILTSENVIKWHKQNFSNSINYLELPIIHNDVHFRQKLEKSITESNKLKLKYNLKGVKLLLYVGRLAEEKNLMFLLKGLSRLDVGNWKMIFIGNGPMNNELIEFCLNNGIEDKTYFIGRKEGLELLAWYNLSHLFILPSISERYGAVVNEALLAGNKVLCSQLAGASSLINYHNGELFDPYNIEEFTSMLKKNIENIEGASNHNVKLNDSKMNFTFEDKIKVLFEDIKS